MRLPDEIQIFTIRRRLDNVMRDIFWETLDDILPLFQVLFGLSVVFLVLLLFTVPFLERGSGSYYVTFISLVVIFGMLVGSAVVIRKCRAYTRDG